MHQYIHKSTPKKEETKTIPFSDNCIKILCCVGKERERPSFCVSVMERDESIHGSEKNESLTKSKNIQPNMVTDRAVIKSWKVLLFYCT